MCLNIIIKKIKNPNKGIFYNNIGCTCSSSRAYSIVFIKYDASKAIDRGLVIGLSCLKGTK